MVLLQCFRRFRCSVLRYAGPFLDRLLRPHPVAQALFGQQRVEDQHHKI